jgi:hypothetical protein
MENQEIVVFSVFDESFMFFIDPLGLPECGSCLKSYGANDGTVIKADFCRSFS